MDRQVKAVEKAIEGWLPNDGLAYPTEQMAEAAIAASDASLVPGLVDALDRVLQLLPIMLPDELWDAVEHANAMIASLPPEYRNATQENDDE